MSNVAGIKNIPKEYKEIHLKAFFHSHPEFLENKPEPEKIEMMLLQEMICIGLKDIMICLKKERLKIFPYLSSTDHTPIRVKIQPYKFQYAPYYNRINESKVEKYQDLYNKLIPTLKLRNEKNHYNSSLSYFL